MTAVALAVSIPSTVTAAVKSGVGPVAQVVTVVTVDFDDEGRPVFGEVETSMGQVDQVVAEFAQEGVEASPAVPIRLLNVVDPGRGQQWGHDMLSLDWIHNLGFFGDEVVVGVVDTGVDGSHLDLEGQLVDGFDFVTMAPTPAGTSVDSFGHGTHVAGIIAAVANNGRDIAGAAPNAQIMPLRVFDADGSTTEGKVAAAIVWAVDNGADVVNLSLGSPAPGSALSAAVTYAAERNVVVFAAAGNNGVGGPVMYPAGFEDAIGVGALNSTVQRAGFSTVGPHVELAAPGAGILSLKAGGGTLTSSGTSMSTPYAAAVASLLLAAGTPAESVRTALQETARDLGAPGRDTSYGFGAVDPAAALEWSGVELPVPLATNVAVSVPSRVSAAGARVVVKVAAVGKFLNGAPVTVTFTPSTSSAAVVYSALLDESGSARVEFFPKVSGTVTAESASASSKSALVKVRRSVAIASVKTRKKALVVSVSRSDRGGVSLQYRTSPRGKWRTVHKIPPGSGLVKVRMAGNLSVVKQLRVVAPARPGLLKSTSTVWKM